MKSRLPLTAFPRHESPPASSALLPALLRALLIHFALWAVLCAVAAITTYGDASQYGYTRSFLIMALGWWLGYLVP